MNGFFEPYADHGAEWLPLLLKSMLIVILGYVGVRYTCMYQYQCEFCVMACVTTCKQLTVSERCKRTSWNESIPSAAMYCTILQRTIATFQLE